MDAYAATFIVGMQHRSGQLSVDKYTPYYSLNLASCASESRLKVTITLAECYSAETPEVDVFSRTTF